jgi:hypothetical protein
MTDVMDIGAAELRHIVWEQMDVRPSPHLSSEQLHDFLQYRLQKLPPNPVDTMRDELISFIKTNKNRLSLPCGGDCYQHSDGMVISCYQTYQEDTDET